MTKPQATRPITNAEANISDELDADQIVRLDRFAPALITWAAHRLAANNGAVYRTRFNVTLMEWRILLHLYAEPNSNAAKLVAALGFDKATISRTVDGLHKRGLLIEKHDPADGRSSQLDLTEDGRELYRQILPVAMAQERELLGDLSRDEAETLVDLMSRVVQALRRNAHGSPGSHSPTAGTMRRLQRRKLAAENSDT